MASRNSDDPDVAAVLAARYKQIGLGYDDAHDADEYHQESELAMAAAYMAWPKDTLPEYDGHPVYFVELLFPPGWDEDLHSFRQGKTPYERLAAAAALVLAEMRRLRMGGAT